MQLQTNNRNQIVITYLGWLCHVTILLAALFTMRVAVQFHKVVLEIFWEG